MRPLSPSDRALGDLLVGRGVLSLAQLDEVVALAETWHVHLGDAILSRNWVEPAVYYRALAHHYELPFVDLIRQAPDSALLSADEADIYAHELTIPWQQHDGRIIIATAAPGAATVLFARSRWGANIEFVVAAKFDITWSVQRAFADELSHRAIYGLAERDPEMSARQVLTPSQFVCGYGLLSALIGGFAIAPIATLIVINVAMSLFYLGNFIFKGILISAGGARSADKDESIAIAARQLADDDLPVFTILVPMFREPTMLPVLADALRQLDYPLGKLDIKIVLEAADRETIEVARTLGLEGVFEIIRVPPSQPQTKPKACNYALQFARGEFIVIYDAEDRPEPDQLRKVVATFRRSTPNTACLQCRLNYFNATENWLTRMFTLDYTL
jgi:hypothetical protein